jgi:Fe/S biogenesis protein NfuA
MIESKVLAIAPDALEMIVQLRDNEPGDEEFALSIEVSGLTGPQFTYELAFIPLTDKAEDWIMERHGDLAIIFPASNVDKLDGASLELTDSGLAMNNPNTPASPTFPGVTGELTGPLAEQVQQVIEEQINPSIASHGGGAELVGVDGTVAYLRLHGGCQGCGMAQVTLRQGIERALLDAIEELTGVVDVTDHMSGENPYYAAAGAHDHSGHGH